MSKSIITISLNEKDQIQIMITHDPPPTGERPGWSPTVKLADLMVRNLIKACDESGVKPEVEATLNSLTGELDVITRKKEEP